MAMSPRNPKRSEHPRKSLPNQNRMIPVDAAFILALLTKVLEKFGPETPITMSFRKGHFASGHDLKDFANKLGIELQQAEVEQ